MAAFVRSIEKVSTTFDTTTGVISSTVNLSKGQNETQCVPFYTTRTTADVGTTSARVNDFFGVEMIDNGGTPAVRVHRNGQGTNIPEKHVDIFVVEFDLNVTVKQGTAALTGATASATLSPAIVLANSFCVFSQVPSDVGFNVNDWDDTLIQARFASTTSVDFDRRASGLPDWTVYWYVVESDGTDFLTEYVTASWTGSQQGPTNHTLSNAVTLANAFVIASHEGGDAGDNLSEAIVNFALTGATTLTWYRNHGSTPTAAGTFGVWIVRCSSAEFDVQRFALDLAASTTNDQSITAIDQAAAIVLNSSNIGGGAWSVDGSTAGFDVKQRQNTLVFQTDSLVRAQQVNAEAATGANSRLRFEVIEFALVLEPSATSALVLPGLEQAAAGESFAGVGMQGLPSLNQNAAGLASMVATGAQALPSAGQVGIGLEIFVGTAGVTLPAAVQDAAGALDFAVDGVQILPRVQQSAANEVDLKLWEPEDAAVAGAGWVEEEFVI